ncbi:MAG: SDR family oxidoreductase [Comamonadaceae bacterium]|nr:MAG: SDR family oxidoreductase [Comamonadaceae bacterium]
MRLEGKSALITGAGSGLGRASTLLFAQEGASVVVADKDADRAKETVSLVEQQGGTAIAIKTDVRVESEVAAAVDAAVDSFGKLDILFANAGVPTPRRVETIDQLSEDDWNVIVGTNLTGVFLSAKHAARVMKKQRRGNIIATSSSGSLVGYPGMSAYCGTKGGVNTLVKALAFELGEFGIRVNAILPAHGMSPNFILPEGLPVVGKSYEESEAHWTQDASPVPLKIGRPPSLYDNAKAALYLASDEGEYMTGVLLPPADGGTLSRVALNFPDNWLDGAMSNVPGWTGQYSS